MFSFQQRDESIRRFRAESFDVLVIGGGITGAAVARDASSRGLKVALVEKEDFAFGTSSKSSKLIHGGLRYLENFEFHLVFEALAERTFLLKTCPGLVQPYPFFLPIYQGAPKGKVLLGLGLWLYDFLALFQSPKFHERLSASSLLKKVPFLKKEGLTGGFRYYDASMWDDALSVLTARAAFDLGAAVATYVEAKNPLWEEKKVVGFEVKDQLTQETFPISAKKVISCVGPWTDLVGFQSSPKWRRWLTPSKGVHLVFDHKRFPLEGGVVMSHPKDGRIVFVMPRLDYGGGVTIVGTTDGPTSDHPEEAFTQKKDIEYLFFLLQDYFPELHLTRDDVISSYVGVRPLMGRETPPQAGSSVLQKVSREHHIDEGPGGIIWVAGGKYTTHRKMAQEIVTFMLKKSRKGMFGKVGSSDTKKPLHPAFFREAILKAKKNNPEIPHDLWLRYGADAVSIMESVEKKESPRDPEGFPCLQNQLRYAIKNEMVIHLDDFFFRRVPLFLARKDHGQPWIENLAQVWKEERGCSDLEMINEKERLIRRIEERHSVRDESKVDLK